MRIRDLLNEEEYNDCIADKAGADTWQQTKNEAIAEAASAGATSDANVGTVISPQIKLGPARGKKSYIGSPGKSGTKAPPQPKVIQPKTKMGTAVNALDMKGKNIFGQAAESTIIKRR
jgi:hypothetical protein